MPEAANELRLHVQRFFRTFGVLAGDRTPCGQALGLSHAHALMVLLDRAQDGAVTLQMDLAQALGIDKSNVARLCGRMEAAGHLVQARHPDDARARALALTPKGARLATKVELASRERFLRVAEFLPDGMFLPVIASMRALNEAVAALASETSKKEMKR